MLDDRHGKVTAHVIPCGMIIHSASFPILLLLLLPPPPRSYSLLTSSARHRLHVVSTLLIGTTSAFLPTSPSELSAQHASFHQQL